MAKIAYLEAFPQDEQDDFDEACSRHARDRQEFLVEADAEYTGDGELRALIGTVRVSFRNQLHTYPYGHGTEPWVYPFERDLKSGVYSR